MGVQFHPAEENGGRDDAVTEEHQPGKNAARERETRRQLLVIEAERLEKTRRAVAQMEREEEHSEDVKSRDERALKAEDHHGIDVVMAERILRQGGKTRIGRAHGEMEEVIDDECEEDQAAQHHRARGESSLDNVPAPIALGARLPVFDREPDCVVDMRDHDHKEKAANHPEERPEVAQMLGVTIDPLRSEENLEVAEKMPNNEEDQDHSRHRHDHFPSDR